MRKVSFTRFDALPSPRPKRNPIRGKGCSNPLSASARFSQPPAELTQIPSRRLSLAWPCCFMLLSVACRRHFSENVKLRLGVPSRQWQAGRSPTAAADMSARVAHGYCIVDHGYPSFMLHQQQKCTLPSPFKALSSELKMQRVASNLVVHLMHMFFAGDVQLFILRCSNVLSLRGWELG